MTNQFLYSGGAKKEKWYKKLISPKHSYSGLVEWTSNATRPRPQQRFQTSPLGDSTSCVAQSKAGHIELFTGQVMSAQPIFSRRIGTPTSQGMYLSNADALMFTSGTNTEALISSQKMTDAELDAPNSQNLPFRATSGGVFVSIDADQIADAITQFKGVSVTFESNESEWDAPHQTPVYNGTPTTFGHCIFFFDFYLDPITKEKTFVANDSDGLWSAPNGLRYITESFLLKRATGASYNPSYVNTLITSPLPQPILVQPQPQNYANYATYLLDLVHYFYYKFTGKSE